MDLERIKQNLRLRSGRPRKKQTIQERRAAPPNAQPSMPPAAVKPLPKIPMKDQYSQTDKEKSSAEEAGPKAADPQPPSEDLQGVAQPTSNETVNSEQKTGKMDQPTPISDESDGVDFDLHPPAPRARMPSLEHTSELLFSSGHLDSILHDPQSISRFTAFLSRYRPEYQPLILRYLETQKAIRAIEYANAVAASAEVTNKADIKDVQESVPGSAARLDEAFEKASTAAFKALVGDALPQFITYNLVRLASECLINEVAGRQSGIMHSLVGGLSEVFCITDPNQPDNPIIYASEEFYRYTGFGSEDVIGNNCRFLQGSKTNRDSPRRIKEATENGTEICETLLNYRRDGRPFINLLMIAPLHDNKGRVKYQIGAQVDVSGLVEKGRGLDTFSKYLSQKNNARGRQPSNDGDQRKQNVLDRLRELSEMFDLEESAVVQTHSRANSSTRSDASGSVRSQNRPKALRRLFVSDSGSDNDEDSDEDDMNTAPVDAWRLGQQGLSGKPSGRLPGIYDSYMLIRPAPSLRIIFTSPKLQKQVKSVQSPFLSHIAAPTRTLAGLKESFLAGVPVSAKINFMASPGERRDGMKVTNGYSHEDGKYGKACWISATPLLGSDDRPGVWMVVFVEKSKVPKVGTKRSAEVEAKTQAEASGPGETPMSRTERSNEESTRHALSDDKSNSPPMTDLPIKPKRIGDVSATPAPTVGAAPAAAPEEDADDYHEAQVDNADVDNSSETLIEAQAESRSPPEFVQPKARSGTQTPNIESRNRVVVQPSPDLEQQQQEFEQQHKRLQAEAPEEQPHLTRQRSDTGYESTPKLKLDLQEQRKYTPPPEIDNCLLSQTPRTVEGERAELNGRALDNGSSEDLEDTPVATRTHTRRSSGEKARAEARSVQSPVKEYESPVVQADEPEPEASQEEGQRESINKERPPMHRDPNGPSGLAIDYLAHPGSGRKRVHAEEFGRALQERGGRLGEDEEDSDCLRTPYSVD